MTRDVADVLKDKNIPMRRGVLAATLSTFRIGGPVALLVEPRSEMELIAAVSIAACFEHSFRVIGRGSNILFDDGEIETILIRTTAVNAVRETDGGFFAQCGASLPLLCDRAARRGLDGLSVACGIPGTIGGGVYMNAGAHENALSDVLKSVTAYYPDSGRKETYLVSELNTSYRFSRFQRENAVILSAEFALENGADPAVLTEEMRALRAARRAAQPLDLPSAGSVFRRPGPAISVGKLLDELGQKGRRVGDAAVSEKHAGFIVNLGAARAADVKALIREIQKTAEKERGIRLVPELCFIPSDV